MRPLSLDLIYEGGGERVLLYHMPGWLRQTGKHFPELLLSKGRQGLGANIARCSYGPALLML